MTLQLSKSDESLLQAINGRHEAFVSATHPTERGASKFTVHNDRANLIRLLRYAAGEVSRLSARIEELSDRDALLRQVESLKVRESELLEAGRMMEAEVKRLVEAAEAAAGMAASSPDYRIGPTPSGVERFFPEDEHPVVHSVTPSEGFELEATVDAMDFGSGLAMPQEPEPDDPDPLERAEVEARNEGSDGS